MKKLALLLLIPSIAFAESRKLDEAFSLLNQLNISSIQAELMVQIKANLRDAYKLSEKAQTDLLACLDREGAKREEGKSETKK